MCTPPLSSDRTVGVGLARQVSLNVTVPRCRASLRHASVVVHFALTGTSTLRRQAGLDAAIGPQDNSLGGQIMVSKSFGSPSTAEFRNPPQSGAAENMQGDESAVDVDTWSTSRERDAYMRRRLSILLAAMLALAIGALGWYLIRPGASATGRWWGIATLGFGAVLLLWCLVPYWASRRAYTQRKRATASARVDKAVQDIATDKELSITKLFELNRRQLDEYQEMTKKQQRSAFLLTQIASVVAGVALVVGIVLSFRGPTGAETYVVSGLSGLGALLSAFLANSFFQSHRDANDQLNRYYVEPERTGRILAAERVARFLKDEPGITHADKIIDALLTASNSLSPDPKAASPKAEEQGASEATSGARAATNGSGGTKQ